MSGALALGSFDGLHLGHKAVLSAACAEKERTAVVFDIPPHMSGKSELLCSPEEKKKLLSSFGFSVLSLDFASVKDMPAEDFLRFLYSRFAPSLICCGFNYRFGAGGRGDARLLEDFCRKNGIKCSVSPEQTLCGERISSTAIREYIKSGAPERAAAMLGRNFSFSGTVVHGQARGRQIGFPTLNFDYPEYLVEPKHGVYEATCKIENKIFKAITYIGVRPSFRAEKTICESNLFDFSGDAYSLSAEISLVRFMRGEMVFGSLEELKERLKKDCESIIS